MPVGDRIFKKKFNGEEYQAISQTKKKKGAEALANQYRSFGYKARVHKFGKGGYRVYIRKK